MKLILVFLLISLQFASKAQDFIKFGSIEYNEFNPLNNEEYLEIPNEIKVRKIENGFNGNEMSGEIVKYLAKEQNETKTVDIDKPIQKSETLVVKVPEPPKLNLKKNTFEQIQDLEKIVANNTTDIENVLKLGKLYNLYNKFQKSLEIVKPIEAKIADNNELALIYADANMGMKKYPLAIQQYEKLVLLQPSKSLFEKLTEAYDKMRNKNKTLFYMQKLVDLDSNNSNLLYRTALLNMDYENYSSAITWFKKAEQHNMPLDENYYLNLGNSYRQLKDFGTAITLFEKANEFTGGYNVDVMEQLMYGYYDNKEYIKARLMIDKLLELNPEDADKVYMKGMTYFREGKKDKAEEFFQRAFAMKPELMKLRQARMQF